MLLVLLSILTFSPTPDNPLNMDDSEEGGIFLRAETIKLMENFQLYIQKMKTKTKTVSYDKFDPEQLLKVKEFSCPNNFKKPVTFYPSFF